MIVKEGLIIAEADQSEEDEASIDEDVVGAIHNSDSLAEILQNARADIGPALRSLPAAGPTARPTGTRI